MDPKANNIGKSLFTQTGFRTLSLIGNSSNDDEGLLRTIIHSVRQHSPDEIWENSSIDFPTWSNDIRLTNATNFHKHLSDWFERTMPYVLKSDWLVGLLTEQNDSLIDHLNNQSQANVTTNNIDRGSDWKFPLFVVYGILIPIIALPGILLNLASLIVLTRRSMRSSVNVYLAGLSFFDGCLLLIALLTFPPYSYCEYFGELNKFWCDFLRGTALLTYPLLNIMQTGSIWTVTAITVDRFIAIIWPLKARTYLTIHRAVVTLGVILAWSIFYNVPSFFELEQVNKTLGPTKLREDTMYIAIYKSYCYLFLMFLIPACLMIVLNIIITVLVKQAFTVRRQMSGRDEKERRCTVMAILVVSTFLVLNLMANITNCIEAFAPSFTSTPLIWTSNLLVTINSAINFFIYCALSLRFRQMFCKFFCPLCYTPEKEYKFLSAYFGTMKTNMVVGSGGRPREGHHSNDEVGQFHRGTDPGGIISMRSLRKPLISSPRTSPGRDAESATAQIGRGGARRPQTTGLTSSPKNVQVPDKKQYNRPLYD